MKVVIKDNLKEVSDSLTQSAELIQRGSIIQMFRALTILEAEIKNNIRSKSGLQVRSGTLLNSIQKEVGREGKNVFGVIGPENVIYAAIHEFGGVIPRRFVKPRGQDTKALSWIGPGGNAFFSKGHWIPETTIPARPYLKPAFEAKKEIIREKFNLFIESAFDKAFVGN